MNEAETKAEYIDPKLKARGWGVIEDIKILTLVDKYSQLTAGSE